MAKPTAKPPGAWIPTRGRVAKIMLWYVGLNTVWILSFSWLLERFVHNHATEDFWELANGFLAVLLTAVFLGLALDRSAREIRRSTEKLEENEARLRVVGDNLPDSYVYEYVHDETGKPCFTYSQAGGNGAGGNFYPDQGLVFLFKRRRCTFVWRRRSGGAAGPAGVGAFST